MESTSDGAAEETSEPGQPLGRGEHARRRIMQAAIAVLAADGMTGFTVEAVARRAAASKMTVYRHWSSASALLVDAMDAGFQPSGVRDSGDVRTDLVHELTAFAEMLDNGPFAGLMAAFVDASERDTDLAGMHARLTERRRECLRRPILAAVQRGELRDDIDAELAVDMLAGPFFYRRFIAHTGIPTEMPAAVVDAVLAALGYSVP